MKWKIFPPEGLERKRGCTPYTGAHYYPVKCGNHILSTSFPLERFSAPSALPLLSSTTLRRMSALLGGMSPYQTRARRCGLFLSCVFSGGIPLPTPSGKQVWGNREKALARICSISWSRTSCLGCAASAHCRRLCAPGTAWAQPCSSPFHWRLLLPFYILSR